MNISVTWFKSMVLALCFLILGVTTNAQNWEVDMLKSANPQVPNSNFWKTVTNSSKPVSFAVPVILLAAGIPENNKHLRRYALESFGTLAINIAVVQVTKTVVDRQRPYQTHTGIYPDQYENGKSFVSGHTALAFGTATTLSLQFKKWYVAAPVYAWAAAVGYSRLYVGQHYPTDLIGAAVVGTGSAWISHKANKWLVAKKQKRLNATPQL